MLGDLRGELKEALERGDTKIGKLTQASEHFEARRILIPAGEPHEYVYRLREGWTGRARSLPDGRTQYILIFIPGDLFALKSMFVPRHPDAVETLSKVVVDRIDQAALRAAYADDPDVALRCTWQVVEEERRLHNWVVSLGCGDASERIAYLLLQFRYRLATAGAIAPDALAFELPMTQQQIAEHLGLSLVHTNKALRKLRDAQLIAISGRTYCITDHARLVKLAEPLLDMWEIAAPEVVGPAQVRNEVA
jgi:CRP-like cAMP-binding protein